MTSYVLLNSCGNSPSSIRIVDNTARLSWIPPTENTDGSVLTDLTYFDIYYGIDSVRDNKIRVDANITEYVITGLTTGHWQFGVTAVNSLGVSSDMSQIVWKNIY